MAQAQHTITPSPDAAQAREARIAALAEHISEKSTFDQRSPSVSRRSVLAAAGTAALAASASAVPAHADGALITMGNEADRIAALLTEFEARKGLVSLDPEFRFVIDDAEYEHLNDRHADLFDLIVATPAHTIEGMRVKARAALWCHSGTLRMPEENHGAERHAMSIVRDLLALTN